MGTIEDIAVAYKRSVFLVKSLTDQLEDEKKFRQSYWFSILNKCQDKSDAVMSDCCKHPDRNAAPECFALCREDLCPHLK